MDDIGVKEEKSYAFAVRIYRLCDYLQKNRKEYIITNQLFRSGTAVRAILSEARFAQSTADYISKHQMALKEASESKYWIRLLYSVDIIDKKEYESLYEDVDELIRIIASIVKTTKQKEEKDKKKKI